jgi:hypothetical protein
MASRPILAPFSVITNVSMTTSVISVVTLIQNTSQIGYDISWTGAPVGTFSVQVSNTYSLNADGSVRNPGNWTTLTLSTIPTVTGTPGNGYIDIDAISSFAIRLVYNATSGTGTLNATVNGKVS